MTFFVFALPVCAPTQRYAQLALAPTKLTHVLSRQGDRVVFECAVAAHQPTIAHAYIVGVCLGVVMAGATATLICGHICLDGTTR